jgi:N-acylneuraminate cytidylyltransferase
MLKSKSIRIVALVPMKGHSERIPSKNLKHFNGVPLYHRVLTTLLSSKYIDAVVINTDGALIKEDILLHFDEKVIIHDRPKEIQGDFVSMNEIIAYDIAHEEATFYLQTHSTNPLLTVASIDKAIEKMIELVQSKLYDSIFSVTKIQTRLYDAHMKPVNHNPAELIRTQDLPPLFEENSNFYIFSKNSFINNDNKRIGKSPYMFELDKTEAIDIDEPQDFVIAEAIDKVLR